MLSLLFNSQNSAFAHICLKTEAVMLLSPLVPFILTQFITKQTNPKETQTAASNTFLPRSLAATARTADVSDSDHGGVGGGWDSQTHWLWHFELTRDIRDGNMRFVLSASVPNNVINKAEQRGNQSQRSKIRPWLWKHSRFKPQRRECAASWCKRTPYLKVESSLRVPFV